MNLKNLTLTFLAACLFFPVFSQSIEDLDFGTDSTLEIASWNLEWFPKNGQTTINYVSDIIKNLEIDIIALQELSDYDSFVEMVEGLDAWEGIATANNYLNLGYIYNPEFVEMTDIYSIFTNLSREFPRPPLVIEILFNEEKYILINNHLKASGDGYMDLSDPWDEETRRHDACILIDEYIRTNLPNDNVIVLGDLNDMLTDVEANNVFQVFFDQPESYLFADLEIAEGPSSNWSYPTWPSHLDHLLISNELFDEFEKESTITTTIRIDDYLEGGWWEYDNNVTDHRPVAIKFIPNSGSTQVTENQSTAAEFRIYPNPFVGSTTIHFKSAEETSTLEIYDSYGKKITSIPISRNQNQVVWNANKLPYGIYHVHLRSNHIATSSIKAVLKN